MSSLHRVARRLARTRASALCVDADIVDPRIACLHRRRALHPQTDNSRRQYRRCLLRTDLARYRFAERPRIPKCNRQLSWLVWTRRSMLLHFAACGRHLIQNAAGALPDRRSMEALEKRDTRGRTSLLSCCPMHLASNVRSKSVKCLFRPTLRLRLFSLTTPRLASQRVATVGRSGTPCSSGSYRLAKFLNPGL